MSGGWIIFKGKDRRITIPESIYNKMASGYRYEITVRKVTGCIVEDLGDGVGD